MSVSTPNADPQTAQATCTYNGPTAGPPASPSTAAPLGTPPCPATLGPVNVSTAAMPEGPQTVSASTIDAVTNSGSSSWSLKIDHTPPTAPVLSGSLWDHRSQTSDHRNEGLYDAAYTLNASSSDARAGLKSFDVQVDNGTPYHYVATCSGTDGCSGSIPPWTFNSDSYTDGDHTITVTAKDQLADQPGVDNSRHVSTTSFQVTVDRRGDIYHATSYEGDPAATDQLNEEWAQIGTQNMRQVTSDDIVTRNVVACPTDPLGCVQEHSRTRDGETDPTAPDDYGTETGTTHNDARMTGDSDLLAPANSNLGTAAATGDLMQALQPWQTAPPGHGATFALYTTTDPSVDGGQSSDIVTNLWIDESTKMPLHEQTVEGGQVTADAYYSYDRSRLTAGELPADEFSVGAPVNVGSTTDDQLPVVDPAGPSDPPDPTQEEQVSDSIAFRDAFGLNSDPTYVQSVVADPANDPAVDQYGVPLTPAEVADLDHRVDVQAEIDTIDAYGDAHPDSYAGVYVDQLHGGLIYVGFTANADANFAAVKAQFAYPDMLRQFPTTPAHTYAELQALDQRVQTDVANGTLAADGVVSAGINEETNKVEAESLAPTAAAAADLQARYGDAVTLVQRDQGGPADSAITHHIPPNIGGLEIDNSRNGACTSGFGAYKRSTSNGKTSRRYFDVTAGHCTDRYHSRGYNVAFRHTGKLFGRVRKNTIWPAGKTVNADALTLRIPQRAHSNAYFLRSKDGKAHIAHVKSAYKRVHRGELMCHSGWATGKERCGHVEKSGQSVTEENGTVVTDLVRVTFGSKCWVRQGDSGGPVYTRRRDRLAGITVWEFFGNCGTDSNHNHLGNVMEFSPVANVLADLGHLTLLTR
jgi:hypothetical protein